MSTAKLPPPKGPPHQDPPGPGRRRRQAPRNYSKIRGRKPKPGLPGSKRKAQ